MTRLLFLVAVVLVLGGTAGAQTTSTSTSTSTSSSSSTSTSLVLATTAGILASAQAASGPPGKIVCISQSPGARILLIDVVGTSTPSATFQIEHSDAPNTANSWAIIATPSYVAMTGIALSTGTPSISVPIQNPVGCYRTNITTYATGNFLITYQAQL